MNTLSERYISAFGHVLGMVVAARMDRQFSQESQQPSNYQTFVWSDTAFDSVTLYRGGLSFDFAFRATSQEYSTTYATPPLLNFIRKKNLIISQIDGVDDVEIVERYNTEPYDIDWRGLLIDMENHVFPLDKLQTLNEIFQYNGVWNVSGELFDKLGITAVYIQSVEIDFVEGYEDTIAYIFKMRAIKDLEYQLLNQ